VNKGIPEMKAIWNRRCARIAMLAAMLSGCEPQNSFKPPPPPTVTVSRPVWAPVSNVLEFTGNTQAVHTVQLRARVEGYLEKILFQEGDIVKQDQLLFVIQQNTYEAKLKQAQAELLAAKARLMHSETEFARFSGLVKQNAAAQTDVDRWHYERDANRADVMASEAQVELAKLNLSYTMVRAPFVGRISRRYKDPGNVVGAGEETVLAEINQIDPIYAYFTISERDLLQVRGQEPANVKSYKPPDVPISVGLANEQGYPHQGRLDYAGIQIDTNTGTLQLRATLPNPDYSILPGLFVRIRAERPATEQGWHVPEDAVGFDQAGAYVLVAGDKDLVVRKPVTLGPKSGKLYSISSGIGEQDRIIVNGLLRAIPGRPVTPVEGDSRPAQQPTGATPR
jgi:RND family efflux transporter MFP subunit